MKTANEWLKILYDADFITIGNWEEELASLIVLGALEVGANKKKVYKWIKETTDLLPKREKTFNLYWKRLKNNKVFVNGKVKFDPEYADIELSLLMAVQFGLVKRVE